jgi:hypothetical protein
VLVPTLLVAWVLAAPFAAGALIARSPRLRRRLARVYPLALTTGWLGLALLAAGAHALDGPVGAVALAAGGPLAGLSFWSRDDTNWDAFERGFRDYVAGAPRPSVPVGRA